MKFSFNPSPNYRKKQSTTDIMRDLTIALVAVLTFAAIWYGVSYGLAGRVILMTVFAVGAAMLTETAYFAITKSEHILHDVLHSYGWVTALIMVLITRIDVSYYAMVISVVVAIVFVKLVFGGFGQNIFNPAAFGAALIMNTFASSTAPEVTSTVLSGATPMATMGSVGWAANASVLDNVINSVGGLGNMFMGNYASVIGGSCALVIIAAAAYLIYKQVIDWRLTVPYVATIFVVSLIVGLVHGSGINFALFNVLGGGVLFGAVFMITDPVTTPVTNAGKVIFAICCGALTLLIRWKAALPDGVLFSILLMNMLTPAIDKVCDGSQVKDGGKIKKKVCIISAIAVAVALFTGITLKPVEKEETAFSAPAAEIASVEVTETR